MPVIHVLDSETIDKIAAGEVVERPSSVVKELVENAIDAGATAVTVEARDGGITLLRVTDNGCGMAADQVRNAFLRHATSKIDNAGDLERIVSLGFRGEALSSIAAVSRVEMITKTSESLSGTRILIEGGQETALEEVGAPDGTTFIVRNLFYNVPVRRKFLKQPSTEAGYITDLTEHLALSRPDISIRLVIGGQTRFQTSGNGDLKEVIYRIYGREIAASVFPIQSERRGMKIEGYLGTPVLVRANRNFEIYYMNGRYIRSTVVARSLEEGYKEYLMQHKFPFCVLHLTMDPQLVDVNVHPTKMDVRFSDNFTVSEFLSDAVREALKSREMIPQSSLKSEKELRREIREEKKERGTEARSRTREPFEHGRLSESAVAEETAYKKDGASSEGFEKTPVWERVREISSAPAAPEENSDDFFTETTEPGAEAKEETAAAEDLTCESSGDKKSPDTRKTQDIISDSPTAAPEQLNLFDEKILSRENRDRYKIIGQVFDTYWMFEFEDKLCILDQHAAHEKVKYERLMKRFREKEILSQSLLPPVIVSLTGQEEAVLREYGEIFAALGFEVESFGGREYALRSVPVDLYGCSEREMFLEVLDELESGISRQSPRVVEEKIASMACKAAVKGSSRLSLPEADRLISELLTLDNPYNCPHGRPTVITVSKYEMEKKFKRIV